MTKGKIRGGFTLVEAIVASVILCGAVLAIGSISTRTLTATKLNRQYQTACRLADKQLSIIDYIGVEDFLDMHMTDGEFEELEQGYRWQVTTEPLDIDNLYQVKMTTSWVNAGKAYSISIDTRLNGTGKMPTMEPPQQ